MKFWMLSFDEGTGVWTERAPVALPEGMEMEETVWQYDGAVLGADVRAANLEEAIDKANQMVKACSS